MPQITVGSANINSFGFSASFDTYGRSVLMDTSVLSSYAGSSGSGIFQVQGICFSLVDSDGVELMGVDWANPQIVPSVDQQYTLDLTSLPFVFLFQNYKITGYIKDANGTVYSTDPIYKKICKPVNLTDSGYVPGIFQIIPDCVNNNLTLKELTVFTYSNSKPDSVSKSGVLSYPTGTISAVNFSGTPFSNTPIYTGEYRVACTSVGTYDLGDDIYVLVTYLTNNTFPVTCTNRIADLLCCIEGVQQTSVKRCNDAVGAEAKQKLNEISSYLLTGLLAEINGQDASVQADYIKKALRCDCGVTSIHQNEQTPINPNIYSIIITGAGGTSVDAPTVIGNTKSYEIVSNSYQVKKGNLSDLAFAITTDTSVSNTVKYVITFDYYVMAAYILTKFEGDAGYIARLQALIGNAIDLSGLIGRCVLNTSTNNYTLQITGLNAGDTVAAITINGIIHLTPSALYCNNPVAVASFLNSLSLGTFVVTFNAGILTVTSANNGNTLSTMQFGLAGGVQQIVQFQSNTPTLVQVLQAIIDYLCAITALQVALGNTLTLYQIDYNGDIVNNSLTPSNTQNDFNIGVANSIYNIVQRINTLTGITCAKIAAIFQDYPNVAIDSTIRVYGKADDNCTSFTDKQIALSVIRAIQSYSDVKTQYCLIDCAAPATCPDISDISLAMSGANIGIYGLSWGINPVATQMVTVKYKLSSSGVWIVSTNALQILPNGNISGTTPYVITGVAEGVTYDVQIINNCGGVGFSKQITTPSSLVYSNNYLLENMLYLICGRTPITLYSSAPFGAGITLYINIGLTIPVTGYLYVTQNGYNIFNLNTSTGVVGADTGSACTTGTGGLYRLGNSTATICATSQLTLYTNGDFVVGGTLYLDVALTTPVTGSSYVEVASTIDAEKIIYNLNSSTGAIGASTGLLCA